MIVICIGQKPFCSRTSTGAGLSNVCPACGKSGWTLRKKRRTYLTKGGVTREYYYWYFVHPTRPSNLEHYIGRTLPDSFLRELPWLSSEENRILLEVARFRFREDQSLSSLAEKGYVKKDAASGSWKLTPKGRIYLIERRRLEFLRLNSVI